MFPGRLLSPATLHLAKPYEEGLAKGNVDGTCSSLFLYLCQCVCIYVLEWFYFILLASNMFQLSRSEFICHTPVPLHLVCMCESDFVYELEGDVMQLSICVYACEFNKLMALSLRCVPEVHQRVALPLIAAFTSMLIRDNVCLFVTIYMTKPLMATHTDYKYCVKALGLVCPQFLLCLCLLSYLFFS